MNTSQMLITIGALLLLGLVILRVNNGFLNTDSVLLDSKLGVLATSVATSIMEEANSKAFDQNTDTVSVSSLTQLSSVLGPESGETYPHFNDFDDFNGYHRVDTTMPAAKFIIDCKVEYVLPANPDSAVGTRTWHKKLTVEVSSPSLIGQDDKPDTLRMSTIYSYWYFR